MDLALCYEVHIDFVLQSTYVLFSSSTYSLKYAKIQLMQYLDNTLLNKIQIMDVIY